MENIEAVKVVHPGILMPPTGGRARTMVIAQEMAAEKAANPGFNLDGWISVKSGLPPPVSGTNSTADMIVVDMNSDAPHATIAKLHYCHGEALWAGCNATHWLPTSKPQMMARTH